MTALGNIERRICRLEQWHALRQPQIRSRIIFDDLKGGFNDRSGQPLPQSHWWPGKNEFVIQIIGGKNAH